MNKGGKAERAVAWRRHGPWAALFGAAWLASFFIAFESPIQLCLFLRWTSYPCMFCGFTRTFAAVSQGAWGFALRNAPFAVFLYVGMVAAFVWNLWPLIDGKPKYAPRLSKIMESPATWIIVAILVLLNWAYRLHLGLK